MTKAERKAKAQAAKDMAATAEETAPEAGTAEETAPEAGTAEETAPEAGTAEETAPEAGTEALKVPISVMDDSAIMEKAKSMGLLHQVQHLIIAQEQEELGAALIRDIKKSFAALRWPFRDGETVSIRVKPENGDYTVSLRVISAGASGASTKAGNRVEVTSPEGETVTADSAAAYCRGHGMNPNGASAVAFLRAKKYTVRAVDAV